jgi:hypothetical protein
MLPPRRSLLCTLLAQDSHRQRLSVNVSFFFGNGFPHRSHGVRFLLGIGLSFG